MGASAINFPHLIMIVLLILCVRVFLSERS